MALSAQHGHGKSDKLPAGLSDESIDGVVFAARNERPDKLVSCVSEIRAKTDDCELLLDPQYYVSTFSPPKERYLPDYDYYQTGLTATNLSSARRLANIATETLNYQRELGLDGLISPTILFDTFSDRWHQIALNMADASLEAYSRFDDAPPLLLSFVFSEEALGSDEEVDRFLDAITQDGWNMDGFYFIVARRETAYSQRFDAQFLSQLMYLTYALTEVNGLEVIHGYTDFVGIPLRAVGARTFATGWSQSLRRFHRQRFIQGRGGGQTPRVRYSSGPLMNSVFLGELEQIEAVGELDSVLSGVDLDDTLRADMSGWTNANSQRHHWQTLKALEDDYPEEATSNRQVVQRVRELRRTVGEANALYLTLEGQGVQFERNTGKDHLADWASAIQQFQTRAGIRP